MMPPHFLTFSRPLGQATALSQNAGTVLKMHCLNAYRTALFLDTVTAATEDLKILTSIILGEFYIVRCET